MGEQAERWDRGKFSLNHAAGQSLCQKSFCLRTHPPLTHDNPCCPLHVISCQYFDYTVPSCSPWTSGTKPVIPLQQLDGIPGPHGQHCSSSVTPTGVKSHRSWRVSNCSAELFDFLFFFFPVLIPMASVYPIDQNSYKVTHIVYVAKQLLTLPRPGPRSFSAEWGCVRAYPQAATGCLHSAAPEAKSGLCSHMRIFAKFCVWSRSVRAGVQWYCYFN